MANYIAISRKQFEDFLEEFTIIDDSFSKEIIYEKITSNPKLGLRIYSSIDVRSGETRDSGEDAIRCVLFDNISGKPIDKAKRTNRTEHWKDRLKEKLDILNLEVKDIKTCSVCKSAMVLRKSPKGEFYGCLSYPNCKGLINKDGSFKETKQVSPIEDVRCPECDAIMIKRNGRRGEFYGCTQFFKTGCKGTLQVNEVEIYGKGIEVPEPMIAKTVIQQELPIVQVSKSSDVKIIPTSDYPHLKFKFKDFNPVQSELFKYYDKDINCVVAAATSAGKTTIAEMFMADSIAKGKKAIFLSPLKAVSQEKYGDWTDPSHDWSKLNVSIVTGDYQLTEKRVEELNNANVIIMTTEMLDSRTRRITTEKNDWLLKAGTIVQDESHLLCMKGRGDKTESAIMRFTKQNPSCRVVFLSATMPNVDELARWLTSLNKKKSELINSDYRPCQLDIHYEAYNDTGRYQQQESSKIERAIEITQQFRDDKFIVFVHSKKTGNVIYKQLQQMNEDVEWHNADIDLKTRIKISQDFKTKSGIRVVVATSTLAWGVNLPARRVVVVGVHRGMTEVEPLDIKQMVGRSGRVGLDPRGDAHVLLPQSKFTRYKAWCQNIPPIKSTMNDADILAFHIISEIAEGEVWNIQTLMDWYNRSLAAFQNNFLDRIDAEELINKLIKIQTVEKIGNKYKITPLGRVASLLYFSPYSIAGWYFNFNKIFNSKIDDISISWALANISDNNKEFVNRDLQSVITNYVQSCRMRGLDISDSCAVTGCLFHACLTYSDQFDGAQKSKVKFDLERIMSALNLIDKMHAHWNKSTFFDKLQLRIQYEVTEDKVELCTLKKIGGMRARELFDVGVSTISEFKRKKKEAISVLGEKTYNSILKENNLD